MDPDLALRPGGRWEALNGMRAFAVISVMLFHLYARAGATWDPLRPTGGFLGVDVFYVLSGFLITHLLVAEVDKRGRISLRSFYARRALRLFPALALLLVVSVTASLVFTDRFWSRLTLVGLPWVLLYVGNWYVVTHATFAPLGLVGQVWSLGVEEQFYLLWPVILIGIVHRFTNRLRIAQVLAVVALGEMVYRFAAIEVLHWSARDRIFFGSDTHSDGLVLGCALAFYLSSRHGRALSIRARRWLTATTIVAVVALLLAVLRLSFVAASSVWFGIPVAVVCTVVIVFNQLTHPLPVLSHVLGSRPAVWVGKRSYGLYLWQATITMGLSGLHWGGLGSGEVALIQIAMTFGVAALSYRFVELPFLRRKRAFARAPVTSLATAAPGGRGAA
ncbi:MAG: acyltransferase [Actinomycetota bacterium]|nr:acyltransferase [Actinomycetota bacterium]